MAKYSGSGWHKQSIRHSNARKYGKAGGTYALPTPQQARAYVQLRRIGATPKQAEKFMRERISKSGYVRKKSFGRAKLSDYQLELINNASSHKTNTRLAGDLTAREKETLKKLIEIRFPKEASQSYIDEWADRIHYNRAWRSADTQTRKALKKANPHNFPLTTNQDVIFKDRICNDDEIMRYFANQMQAEKEGYKLQTRKW